MKGDFKGEWESRQYGFEKRVWYNFLTSWFGILSAVNFQVV